MERVAMEEQEQSLGEMLTGLMGIVIRRRWFLIVPPVCLTLAASVAVFLMSNKYESDATLVVVQQRISQRFVEPSSVIGITELFQGITREILSRNQLIKIINEFGLYEKARKANTPPERLAELMRKDLKVEPMDFTANKEMISFRIAFAAATPQLARDVTSRLASLFVEENLKRRSGQALTTARFLSDQLEAAKQRLAQQEQKVRDFKIRNLDQLPQQEQANLGAVTDLRIQLQSTLANQTRAHQQRVQMEALLNGHLARLQSERESLLTRYTAKHPEVVKKNAEIERAAGLLSRLRTPAGSAVAAPLAPGQDDPIVAQLRSQVEANLAESDSLSREEARLKGEIARFQNRLKLTPVREQELTDILRDYELYKKDYNDLLNKQLEAQLSATLEERQEGQQFRLVDPPSLPTIPSSPKRFKITLGALGAGLVLGALAAFLMEMRDRSFHGVDEVRNALALPFVVGIPMLSTEEETKRKRMVTVFEWVAGGIMLLAVAAAEFYVLRHG